MICTLETLLIIWCTTCGFPVVSTAYIFRTQSFISLSPNINLAILPKYYLCLITENYMRPLIYSPVQFPATQCNPSLAVDLRNCDFLGHYSTFVPFPKQSSANCSRWNITASSLINSCCFIFQSLSSVCFRTTKKNPVIPRSRSSTPTSWQVFNVSSFSHPLQKFLDCSTVDACHIVYFIARKTFIWQIYNYFFLLGG
jgi:hypothetical protein